MKFERMTVTPAMAEEWLGKNSNNRAINRPRVLSLRDQIMSGDFVMTHQGIAFYGNFEEVADGQHRLAAIVEANKPVEMMVSWGLDKRAAHGIDRGKPRSISNTLHFVGVHVTPVQSSVCRTMLLEYECVRNNHSIWNSHPVGTQKFIDFYNHVAPAIEFALQNHSAGRAAGLRRASAVAAIACAWFTQDRDKIERFSYLLYTGIGAKPSESAAIKLRDFLLTYKLPPSGSERYDIFIRSCNALRAFLENRPLSKLYATTSSRFPIPDCPGL
jgi:hypothetical protein